MSKWSRWSCESLAVFGIGKLHAYNEWTHSFLWRSLGSFSCGWRWTLYWRHKKHQILPFPNNVRCVEELGRGLSNHCVSSQDEVNKITLLSYMQTRQELQSPFMSAESPVRRVGLSLVLLDIKTFPCPYTKMRLEIGDTEKVAKSLTEETRAWGNFTFLSGSSFIYSLWRKKIWLLFFQSRRYVTLH